MKKIVLGIVIMAVLLGGLGAGFATGYEYKCMEEERLFDELFAEANEEYGCSCYYTGDMWRGFECLGDCLDIRMEECYEVAYEEGYDAGYRDGYQFGELDGRQMVFELMRDVGSGSYDAVGDCLIVRDFDSDGAHRMPWPREKVKYVVWEEKIE